jgi:DNA-directed RNA polymerase specialized sigma24 family protein
VELATAYLNPSPQLKQHANQLPGLASQAVWNPDSKPALETGTTSRAWALARRLSEASRSAIVADYQSGARQQVLADRYEISLSSIKRLLRDARDA